MERVSDARGVRMLEGRLGGVRPIVLASSLYGAWPCRPDDLEIGLDGRADLILLQENAVDEYRRQYPGWPCHHGAVRVFRAHSEASRVWLSGRDARLSGMRLAADVLAWLYGRDARPAGRRLVELEERNLELTRRVGELRAEVDRLKSRTVDSAGLFLDWRDEWDFMIRVHWARRVPAELKRERLLPASWDYDEGFEERWRRYRSSVDRYRLLDALVDALDGADVTSKTRRRHALRESVGAGESARLSDWGSPIWRVDLTKRNGFRLQYTDNGRRMVLLGVYAHDEIL